LAKQTGKGRQRRAGALERKATQHHDFIGDAAPERAEAEFRKHERLKAEENREAVQEMAAELNKLAAKGPELRVPRSLDEAKQAVADAKEAVRGAPDLLAEKARQRLGPFREPAEQALHVAAAAANVLLMPARIGLHLLMEVVRLPFSVASALRDREA
jgi:hypothetical protein